MTPTCTVPGTNKTMQTHLKWNQNDEAQLILSLYYSYELTPPSCFPQHFYPDGNIWLHKSFCSFIYFCCAHKRLVFFNSVAPVWMTMCRLRDPCCVNL